MKYMTIWTIKPENTSDAIERFRLTGGPPPPGVTLLGRWHDIGGGRGFTLSESDDPVAMTKWSLQWDDLLSFEVVPVVDDTQIGDALSGLDLDDRSYQT